MNIHEDFEEFLRLLTDEGAEFVVIGGYAVAFHLPFGLAVTHDATKIPD